MVNDLETQGPLRQENQLIAQEIQSYLDQAVQAGHALLRGTAVSFVGKNNPDFEVNLRRIDGGVNLPEGFEFPAYNLQDWHTGVNMSRATSQGSWRDEYFKDWEGNVYSSINSYYFNLKDQGVKSEEIHNMTKGLGEQAIKDILVKRGLVLEEIREVNFSPIEGTRFVNPSAGDYEKIRGILSQIKNGELVNPVEEAA